MPQWASLDHRVILGTLSKADLKSMQHVYNMISLPMAFLMRIDKAKLFVVVSMPWWKPVLFIGIILFSAAQASRPFTNSLTKYLASTSCKVINL